MTEEELRFLDECDERDSFFGRVCRKETSLSFVKQTFRELLGSPGDDARRTLRVMVPALAHLALQSPIEAIKSCSKDILALIAKERGEEVLRPELLEALPLLGAPSSFISPEKIVSLERDEETSSHFTASFVMKGRVSHISRIMGYYTSYLGKFERASHAVLSERGPLPLTWTTYLAIVGASCHNCEYLIRNYQVEFFESGGDPEWLVGLSHAPPKLQKIAQLNALLAHQPWKIQPFHIQDLVSGSNAWSLPEVVQAVCILVTFHCLSGMVLGVGTNLEVDRQMDFLTKERVPTGELKEGAKNDPEDEEIESRQTTSELVRRLKAIIEHSETASVASSSSASSDLLKIFEEIENSWHPTQIRKTSQATVADFPQYRGVEMTHQDFDVRSPDYQILRLQEFSWEGQGFSLLNKYLPEVGDLFDDVFTEALTLTEESIFDAANVDTSPFRQAVWYYVLRLKGMCHDDYEYSQVNACLNVRLKKFLKKIACYPELITKKEYEDLGLDLFDWEKVHVLFLISESRRQAELLYALQAIMKFKGS